MSWEKDNKKARERDKRKTPGGSPGRSGRAPRKCTACDGKGYRVTWTTDRKGKKISYETNCSACNGTGETR